MHLKAQEVDTFGIFPDTLGLSNIADEVQRREPLDSAKIYFFNNRFEFDGPDFIQEIDTLITNTENYDPPFEAGRFFAILGNQGLAHTNMIYTPRIHSGFNFGIRSFDLYRFFNDSINHYWVGKPYTYLFFIQGAKKEQNLHIDHAQNIASWFHAGLRFRYVNSPGYYNNQEGDDKNFVFKTRFQTNNYRYMVLANYIHNKLKIEENGGIVYDSVFEDDVSPDRRGIAINLQNATNYFKENTYFIKQFFKISNRNRFLTEDTSKTKSSSFIDRLNPGNLSLSFRLSQKTWLYQQPTSDNNGFYPFTYDSVNGTYDSVYTFSIENQLSWTNADNAKKQLLTFDLKLRHLYAEHSVDSTRFIFNQLIPTAQVRFRVSNILDLDFFGDFVTGNSNAGDFNLIGKLELSTKFGNLSYSLHNANQTPSHFFSYYRSNHFRWENTLKKQYFLINKAAIEYRDFKAGMRIYAIQNFIYLDTLGFPAQLNKNLQVLQLHARNIFHLGDFNIDLLVYYQAASENDVLRLPEILGQASFYYTKDLFKQAAIIQPGIDVLYNTAYKADAYMPATRSFLLQNNKSIGNFAYVDVFFNLQVKRARLFVKYYNLGFLLGDFRYFTVPDYPMKDGGIRFGVSWMFYD
jgi:hypothetical protein